MIKALLRLTSVMLAAALLLSLWVEPVAAALDIKVGYYDYDDYLIVDEEDHITGYAGEILDKLVEMNTHWNFVPVRFSRGTFLENMRKGFAVISVQSPFGDDNPRFFVYSDYPVAVEKGIFYTGLDQHINYEDFATFQGMRVGTITGDMQTALFSAYQAEHDFTVDYVTFDTLEELRQALYEKEIDGLIYGSMAEQADLQIVARYAEVPLHVAANEWGSMFIEYFDRVLESVYEENPDFLDDMYDKYFGDRPKALQALTVQEEQSQIEAARREEEERAAALAEEAATETAPDPGAGADETGAAAVAPAAAAVGEIGDATTPGGQGEGPDEAGWLNRVGFWVVLAILAALIGGTVLKKNTGKVKQIIDMNHRENKAEADTDRQDKTRAGEAAGSATQQREQRRAEKEARAAAKAEAKAAAEAAAKAEAKAVAEAAAKTKAIAEAAAEEKRRAEAEARLVAEQEAKRLAEQEAKQKAEAEIKRIAEDEARLAAEREVKRLAEQEAKRLAEQETKQKAEAEATRIAEENAERRADDTAQAPKAGGARPRSEFLSPFYLANPEEATDPGDERRPSQSGKIEVFPGWIDSMANLGNRPDSDGDDGAYTDDQIRGEIYLSGLTMSLQPRYSLNQNRVVGAEVSILCRHPIRDRIYPEELVLSLTQKGKLHMLDRYIFESLCLCKPHEKVTGDDFEIVIPVFTESVVHPDFSRWYRDTAGHYGVPPEFFRLDLIYRWQTDQDQQVYQSLRELTDAGFRIALKDVGNANYPLRLLSEVEMEAIVVAEQLVVDALDNEKKRKLLAALKGLCMQMDFRLEADRIDSREKFQLMTDVGCQVFQGNFLTSAIPFEQFWDYKRRMDLRYA